MSTMRGREVESDGVVNGYGAVNVASSGIYNEKLICVLVADEDKLIQRQHCAHSLLTLTVMTERLSELYKRPVIVSGSKVLGIRYKGGGKRKGFEGLGGEAENTVCVLEGSVDGLVGAVEADPVGVVHARVKRSRHHRLYIRPLSCLWKTLSVDLIRGIS